MTKRGRLLETWLLVLFCILFTSLPKAVEPRIVMSGNLFGSLPMRSFVTMLKLGSTLANEVSKLLLPAFLSSLAVTVLALPVYDSRRLLNIPVTTTSLSCEELSFIFTTKFRMSS